MTDETDLTPVLSGEGRWTFAYLDGHGDETQPAARSRRHALLDELRKLGTPEDDVRAVDDALDADAGMPSPSAVYLLVQDGRARIDERFAGARLGPEQVGHGRMPVVLPLLRHRAADIRYVVVEAGREGAVLKVERAGRAGVDGSEDVQGRTDGLPKVQAGGWSHRRYQMHSEEIWKQTQSEVAAALEVLVREHRPTFVVIAGDVRARQLLEEQLSPAVSAIAIDVDVHAKADGADAGALDDAIAAAVHEHLRWELAEAYDRASINDSRSGVRGVREVVGALQRAQVDTLVVDSRELPGEGRLLALDAEPWVALGEDDALDARVIESVRTAEGLARAALLGGATVLVAEEEEPPAGEPMPDRPAAEPIAVLRWPRNAMG